MCKNIGNTRKIKILSGLRVDPADCTINYLYSDIDVCIVNVQEHQQKCYTIGNIIEQYAMQIFKGITGETNNLIEINQ